MKIAFFCPYWGSEHLHFEDFLTRVATAGYDGIEMSMPLVEKERDTIAGLIKSHQLQLIAQHWETIDKDPAMHAANFTERLYNLAAVSPMFINSQTGKDYYDESQNLSLIKLADEIALKTGVSIIHETHRGKWSFAAHITQQYLLRHPSIRITLDMSHWCNVAETFLEDQADALELAVQHTDHIHARVGFTEGPQVTDPRAPEWETALNFHHACWDKVIALKKKQGASQFTITPEFGAPPYLTLLPYTKQPIASQWDMNVFMMQTLKSRYAE